ncbi:4-hydroxyphenylpyruvate dioxygenase [Alternaria alternata]|nr:4-hydroxyphenylpyruvate dioxygenase [Alternaria alternata]
MPYTPLPSHPAQPPSPLLTTSPTPTAQSASLPSALTATQRTRSFKRMATPASSCPATAQNHPPPTPSKSICRRSISKQSTTASAIKTGMRWKTHASITKRCLVSIASGASTTRTSALNTQRSRVSS